MEALTPMSLKVGDVLSNREISRIFNVSVRRGIRYSGSLKNGIEHVVLTTVLNKTPEESIANPYHDRFEGGCLLYTGEGLHGDQQMRRGNLVLKLQMEKRYPIFVFEKKTPGRYMFLGKYNVTSVQTEKQPDVDGKMRCAFVYRLERASPSVLLPIKTLENYSETVKVNK